MNVLQLKEKLEFLVQEGFITNEHQVLIGVRKPDGVDIAFVTNINAPGLVLSENNEFDIAEMFFTKQKPKSVNESETKVGLKRKNPEPFKSSASLSESCDAGLTDISLI
jgi:hypothetical protein